MMDDQLRLRTGDSALHSWFILFVRFVALVCLAGGVYYWLRLIGLYPGLLWRFDLMPWQWQAACVSLAIALPIVATGLWIRASWGAVLWVITAIAQALIYTVLARYFEFFPALAALNIGFLLIYIAFRIGLFMQGKRAIATPVH
ncbi:DUF6163 family protein [Pseudochrobactrum kiredjianiae]|uniref:DUF6163 family protein n=1 Tax=Pseudochrobactrum kiredjianiae TaxID=386305 RepID=A0ABW3V8B7_9HYPH|nr:DUF6163 family protein [Pseudochrobactrum kiredjianiae]MDM7851536.1 DUF6163 family protein [Pseudochrobactrum kiredjianiae]